MPSNSTIEAGRAFLRLYTDDSEFRRGMQGAAQRLDSFGQKFIGIGKKIGAAGALITAPFVAAIKTFTSLGDELQNVSDRTGGTVEALSALKFAAEQTGGSLSTVEAGYRGMARTIGGATKGVEASVNALATLGLTVSDLLDLTPDEQFEKIARAIGRIQDPTQRAAAAMKVFGRSGSNLLPLIKDFDELQAKAEKFNLVLTSEGVKAADRLDDAFGLLRATMTSVAFQIGNAVAPEVTRFTESLALSAAGISDYVKEHKTLVLAVGATGVALDKISLSLIGAGAAFRGGAVAVGIFNKGLAFFIANPVTATIIAITAAIAGLIAVISTMPTGKNSPLTQFTDLNTFGALPKHIQETKDKIAALKAEIAGFAPGAEGMDKMVQDLTRHNLALAEAALKALEATKFQIPDLPAIQPKTPAFEKDNKDLPALLPPLPDDWLERHSTKKALKAIEAIEVPETFSSSTPSESASRFQFGGKGAEQFFGSGRSDTAKRSLDELVAIKKELRKGKPLRIGNS